MVFKFMRTLKITWEERKKERIEEERKFKKKKRGKKVKEQNFLKERTQNQRSQQRFQEKTHVSEEKRNLGRAQKLSWKFLQSLASWSIVSYHFYLSNIILLSKVQ